MLEHPLEGLSALANAYDLLLCDVWGVLHNGVAAFPTASAALIRYRQGGGKVVLVSNAPRPQTPVIEQLRRLGVAAEAYDAVITSGDVTRGLFETAYRGKRVSHLGPDKDRPLVEGLPVSFTTDEEAEVLLCSGLLDDQRETPELYRDRLQALVSRGVPMVCANPDKVVELGDRLIYCAGALADLYQELGGEAVILGKPHRPIYDTALNEGARLLGVSTVEKRRVLALGDSFRTDVRGAAMAGVDCLFFTGGIHAGALAPQGEPNPSAIKALVAAEGLKPIGYMHRLAW